MAEYNFEKIVQYTIYIYIHAQYNHIVIKKVNKYYYFILKYLFTNVIEVHKSTFWILHPVDLYIHISVVEETPNYILIPVSLHEECVS